MTATLARARTFTMGVEEEYQVIDPVTGALRSNASILRATDWTGELVAELQETTVEIGTPICETPEQVSAQIARLRLQAGTVAATQGLAIVAAGVHPFSRWEGHERPPLERYRSIEQRYGRIARDEHIFGMHVHVAVPTEIDRVPVLNTIRHFLPVMLALSASSPIIEGEDTGYVSYRTILWRRWPSSGIPPRFDSAGDYDAYVRMLLDSGTLADRWNVYWSLRLHPRYPTLEFRVMDVCPSMRDAVALAALARVLVVAAIDGVLDEMVALRTSRSLEQELLRTNEWRAARDGLDARLIDAATGTTHRPLRVTTQRLLELLLPTAEQMGDAAALSHIDTILERGSAAERMRRHYADQGSLGGLAAWLASETLVGTGLDRRRGQRD